MASTYGHVDIIQLLLDLGVDVNVHDEVALYALLTVTRFYGFCQNDISVLQCTALRGHLEVVSLLLDRGANIEAANNVRMK